MLGKLFKHEVNASGHYFVPVYLACGLVCVLNAIICAIILLWNDRTVCDMLMPFIVLLFVIVLMGLAAATFFLVFFRFYKTMVSEEGYLTHTLPVNMHQLILSRLFTAIVYSIITCIFVGVVVIGFILLFFSMVGELDGESVNNIIIAVSAVVNKLGIARIILYLFEFAILGVLNIISAILTCYVSISFAQCMKNNKALWTCVFYICIRIAFSFLINIMVTLIVIGNGILLNGELLDTPRFEVLIQVNLLMSMALTTLVAVICYFITHNIFKKKLNLE